MLPAKPWKTEAVIRLCLSVVVCIFASMVVTSLVQQAAATGKGGTRFHVVSSAALLCFLVTLAGLRKSWDSEDLPQDNGRRLAGFFAVPLVCFYAGIFLEVWAQRLVGGAEAGTGTHIPAASQVVFAILITDGGALAVIWLFLREHRTSWPEGFGLHNNGLQSVLFGLLLSSAFLPLGVCLKWLSAQVMIHLPYWHLQPEEQLTVQTLKAAAAWDQQLALGLVTIVLAPAAEESLFRGIFYPYLKRIGRPRLALWGASLLFALMHFNAVSFVPLFVLSVLLTLLYERTGNLLAPLSAHTLFNGINFSMAYWVNQQPL